MRCEDALGLWQLELLGQPVDKAKLEEAHQHIADCTDLCARAKGKMVSGGETDLFEASGLLREEEGNALWREGNFQASRVSWQQAAEEYARGLQTEATAFLDEGAKRVQAKLTLKDGAPLPEMLIEGEEDI